MPDDPANIYEIARLCKESYNLLISSLEQKDGDDLNGVSLALF